MAVTTRRELSEHPKGTGLHILASGTGLAFVGLLVGRAFEYLTRVVVARSLGVSLFGALLLALGLVQIGASLAILGLPSGVTRFVSFEKAEGNDDINRITAITATGLRVAVPLSLGISLALWLSRQWLADVFTEPALATLLGTFAWMLPFLAIFQMFAGLLRGVKDIGRTVLSQDFVGKGMRLALLVILAKIGIGFQGVMFAYVVGFIAMAGSAYWFSRRYVQLHLSRVIMGPTYNGLLSYSLPLVVSTIILQLGGQANDALILGYFQSSATVGTYGAALSTAQLLMLSLIAVRVIFMPVFTELFAAGQWDEIKDLYRSAARWTLYITLPIFGVLFAFPGTVLAFFGQGYGHSILALRILCIGNLISCAVGPTGQILLAIGRTKTHMALDILYVGINLVLNLLLVPWLAATGAAFATAFAMMVWNVGSLIVIVKELRIYPFSLHQLRFIVFMLTIALFTYWITLGMEIKGYITLVLGGVVQAGATFVFVVYLSPQSDQDVLHSIGRRLIRAFNGGS